MLWNIPQILFELQNQSANRGGSVTVTNEIEDILGRSHMSLTYRHYH